MMKGFTLIALLLIGMLGMVNGQDLPLDFESTTVTYTFTDFDGGQATVIPNAQSSGINTSANAGQMIKSAGQVWGGSTIELANPIDFSVDRIFKMKVYSPRVGARLLLKVENLTNGGIFFEKEDTLTVANAWEELSFDFTQINAADQYSKVVLIFDLGVMGDGSANFTFLFDDIELVNGGPILSQIDLPVTFQDATVDYTLVDFGGNYSSVVVDPTDPNNTVAMSTKSIIAELWAGTTMGNAYATPIPITATETKMNARVYSPAIGLPIRFKIEDANDPTKSVETETLSTVANSWETIVFDFSNEATGTAPLNPGYVFSKASIFFNFGATGAMSGADTVYYWDDVMFGDGTAPLAQIDLPVTFEDATVDYTLTDFGGNASAVVVDPTDPANMVGQSTKTAIAELWSGTTIGTGSGFATAVPFSATETKMNMRVWSASAGIPVRLKVEDATNGTISVETEDTTTVAMGWQTMVFDFTNPVSGTAAIDLANTYDKASAFFNFGATGAMAGADTTFYWDDVMFGDGSTPLAQIDLPVTFEDSTVDYTLSDFGGNASAVVVDPTDPANTVGQSTKTASAELWSGTTIGTGSGFATAIPFSATETKMNMLVWSVNAGIPVRLKVEDATNGGISVETEDTTTVAGGWQTMEFDFSNQVDGTAAIDIANTYDKASVFFNFGKTGSEAGADTTFYWDDVMFGASTVGIEDLFELGLSYYPNPVQNSLNVEANRNIESIYVFNTMGQLLMQESVNQTKVELNLNALTPGVYLIRAKIGNQIGTFRVIKE